MSIPARVTKGGQAQHPPPMQPTSHHPATATGGCRRFSSSLNHPRQARCVRPGTVKSQETHPCHSNRRAFASRKPQDMSLEAAMCWGFGFSSSFIISSLGLCINTGSCFKDVGSPEKSRQFLPLIVQRAQAAACSWHSTARAALGTGWLCSDSAQPALCAPARLQLQGDHSAP